LYVKIKWGTVYGALEMQYGRKGCEWLQKRGLDVIAYQIDVNYAIFGQFWTDSSLESQVIFYYEAHKRCGALP
jgi:hypothetical protein